MDDYLKRQQLWEQQRQMALIQKPQEVMYDTIQELSKIASQGVSAANVKVVGQCDNVCPVCLGPYKSPVAG